MKAKLPIIGSTSSVFDALYALAHVPCPGANSLCKARLGAMLDAGQVHTLDSGIAAFYLILEALKTLSPRTEIVLPAYTAGSLVVAVRKAGLKPVLCDVSLQDYNADEECLARAVGGNTLAVAAVHMFGIPLGYMETLRGRIPGGVYLIEDCCQAMGSRIKDKQAGSFSDICFFSFNRGKNLPANNGGCIVARTSTLEPAIRSVAGAVALPGAFDWCGAFLKDLLFCIGTRPFVYGMASAFAQGFRETAPPRDLDARQMGNFQSALCLRGLRRADILFMARYRNGMELLGGLKGIRGAKLPVIREDLWPVFNRFPILLEDESRIAEVRKALWRRGIESSDMYARPLHHMFDLGYDKDDFPNARYLARHLLTLPVHPGVDSIHIKAMIDTLRGIL